MKNGTLFVAAAASLLLSVAGYAQGTWGYTTTWSKANDLAGFETPQGTRLTWVADGGNPGGYIKTSKTNVFYPKPYLRNDMGKVFGTGPGNIKFDVKALDDGAISDVQVFLSTGTQAFSYMVSSKSVLKHDQVATDGWVSYRIPWKADWTEEQALAAGWRPYTGAGDKWRNVIANAVWSYVAVLFIPGKGKEEQSVGLDNFCMDAGRVLDAASLRLIDPPPPQELPIVNYAFDEGEGNILHDRAGNAPDGKISGAIWVHNGGRWALEFDGINSFVNCGILNVIGPQTLVAWVWAEPSYSVWLNMPILGAGNAQLSQRVHELFAGGSGSIPFRKWTHIAVAWDGSVARLYVNGTLENVVVCKEPSAGRELLLAPLRTPQEGDPPEYAPRFKGKIASVLFYNRPLDREGVLRDLRSSNITNSPMTMSIPQPGFNRIKVEVDAARLGLPLQDVAVTVNVLKADGSGQPLGSVIVKEFDEVGRAVADVEVPDLARGAYLVRVTGKDVAGKPLGVPGEESISWAGSARFPSGPEGARRLNNLVMELLSVAGPDNSGVARKFVNPRMGFVYISNRGSKEVKITPEEGTGSMDLTLSRDYGDAFETMRYLPKGNYTITTPAAKELVVRAVAQTVYDYANTLPYVTGFGPYAGEFEQRYVFPHYNTFMVQNEDIEKPFAREWRAKGRRFLAHMGTGVTPKEGQSRLDAACEMFAGGPGFSNTLYDGYLVDEFSSSDEGLRIWSRALERMLSGPPFRGKTFHAWTYGLYDLVTYNGGEPGREFVRTLEKFDCPVQWECYLGSQRTEIGAWQLINDKMVGELLAAEQALPGMADDLIVVPYAGVTAGPPWLTMVLPSYDTRTFLEMQVRTVATHPAFAGVRGLGVYRSPYLDEETQRWMARLFRHYAIEGHTEPLGKDPFLLTHVRNPEFEEGGLGWDVKPAEEGSIELGMHNQFGSIECRYTGQNGDTVLITRRSARAPNVFSQEIRNLEPGRLYSFRMFSADHKDMSGHELNAVNIQFDNAMLVPDKCFTHVGASRQAGKWLNWHVRVFRAGGKSATIRISDWADDKTPGGPIGQELMYNFIKVQPYWPPD